MTTFTGPFTIKQWQSETTTAHIDAAGNAAFTTVSLSGDLSAEAVVLTNASVTALSTAQYTAVEGQADATKLLRITINGSAFGIRLTQLGALAES